MSTPIERARASLYKALKKLPAAGIRTDYKVLLKWPAPQEGDRLSMNPASIDEPPMPDRMLTIEAPDVKPYSGFAMLAVQEANGGLFEVGDHRVRFPRDPVIEAFLSRRVTDLDGTGPSDGPYPDILRLIVEINGVDYRVVRPLTTLMKCDLYVRRMA